MLKFGMDTQSGDPIIGIGLSSDNMTLLLEGKPILVSIDEWHAPGEVAERLHGIRLLIVGGETEESIAADLIAMKQEYVDG